jgi:hypothetical protein
MSPQGFSSLEKVGPWRTPFATMVACLQFLFGKSASTVMLIVYFLIANVVHSIETPFVCLSF